MLLPKMITNKICGFKACYMVVWFFFFKDYLTYKFDALFKGFIYIYI